MPHQARILRAILIMTDRTRTLAEQIRRARLARGWTQAELARACEVEQWTISRIEAEAHPITRGLLSALARALGTELVVSAGPAEDGA